jgi:hypothetical protein
LDVFSDFFTSTIGFLLIFSFGEGFASWGIVGYRAVGSLLSFSGGSVSVLVRRVAKALWVLNLLLQKGISDGAFLGFLLTQHSACCEKG